MKIFLPFIIILTLHSCKNQPNYSDKEKKFIKIAKNAIRNSFGAEILENNEPYRITRKDSVWVVKGTLPDGMDGGVPVVIIDTVNMEVVEIYHTK